VTEIAKIEFDDAVLVEHCRGGDNAAMERLIVKYQDRIYNVILRMCGNCEDAAELTQDTFVKVIENVATFRQQSSFYTWIFRIAVNLTLNHCQRKGRVVFGSIEAGQDETGGQATAALKEYLYDHREPSPADSAQNKELCELVIKAMMRMDDSQRAVVVLRDIAGMDYAQIADVLDVELGTVKSRLSRARNSLREMLEALAG